MKCSNCPYRRKLKEPVGGLRKHGYRVCLKTGAILTKHLVYDINGVPTGRRSYPEGCTENIN